MTVAEILASAWNTFQIVLIFTLLVSCAIASDVWAKRRSESRSKVTPSRLSRFDIYLN